MTENLVTEISETEIIYKGVRFVADPSIPNKMGIYLIKDNHNTRQVNGQTVEEIVADSKRIMKEDPDVRSGIIFLYHGRKEISRRFFTVNVPYISDKPLEEVLKMEDIICHLELNPALRSR